MEKVIDSSHDGAFLKSNLSMVEICLDAKILVEDSNSCTGEFIIYSLIEHQLRAGAELILIAAT